MVTLVLYIEKKDLNLFWLYVTASNQVRKTEHFVSLRTFAENSKESEKELKRNAQRVYCHEH